MSRFLPDTLHVGIEPDQLTLVRRSFGLKTHLLAKSIVPLPAEFFKAPDTALIERELSANEWRHCRAHIVLADRLVRYFLVERPHGARNAAEINLAAALRFEEIFSETASDWAIKLDLRPFATNFLACATHHPLLLVLDTALSNVRIPIFNLSPFGTTEWNRHRRRIKQATACFVAVGHDSAWVAQRSQSRWLGAQVHQLRGAIEDELPKILHRESLRNGLPSEVAESSLWVAGLFDDGLAKAFPRAHLLSAPKWPNKENSTICDFRLALSPVWPTCA